ncbi:MAG TPA: tyrosine/phenylalanine carboxypeptidase domain-containing protein, partial [Patescibacteria group bacterium]|nr:tyrosine/phenylalanine carboxypeptidase domain-containing protein [Patescibacteria group bacterium]
YTIQRLRDRIQKEAAESSSDEVRNAADVLLQSLPVVDPQTHSDLPVPSTELANRVGKNIATEIRSIARIEDGEKKLNASEIRQAFEQAIQKLQLPGWQVIIDQGSSTRIRVSQKDKAVQIPASTNILAKELLPLIGHELKTHVGRRVNGKRSKLHLLALGLDRYLPGEEGIATFHEQALEEQVNDFDGFDGHFAISLAQGLDGKKKDFRDTFEILQKYYLFDQLSKGKSQEEATTEANKLAYNRCIRTFRGSDCNTPGAVYTKDIVYREGNIGVWRVISTNEKEMVRFSVGKYDPANGRHVYMLDQVGINAADLETLAA